MKAPLFFGIFLTIACVTQAADTAYSALRVIGKRDGQEVLNRVVELRGRAGNPNPPVWKVIIDEPRARGGVREIEVQRGKIIGEKTPTSRNVGAPMNFNQLNLDSEGAFTIANQEAQKERVAFDRIDYTLKSGTNGGAPVWELELFDGSNGRMGLVAIAADSGTVLHRQLDRAPRNSGADDRAYLDDRRNPPPPPRYQDGDMDRNYDRDRADGPSPGSLPAFVNRVGRHFQKRGRQIENFFTGK